MSSPQRIVALDLPVVDPMPESIEKCFMAVRKNLECSSGNAVDSR